MLKRKIKKIIEEMEIGEEVVFHSTEIGNWRQDAIKRREDDYTIFSRGYNWIDQGPGYYTKKRVIEVIWNEKPHSCY